MGDVLANSVSTNQAYISTIRDAGFPINLVGYGGIRIRDTQSGQSGVLSVNSSGELCWNGGVVTVTPA
jgi:hypothetical protein